MTIQDYKTEFAKWLIKTGLTQTHAALALGISLSRVKDLCYGASASLGHPAYPNLTQRLAMSAIAEGHEPCRIDGYRGARELMMRLAMAAVRHNLAPWPVEAETLDEPFTAQEISEAADEKLRYAAPREKIRRYPVARRPITQRGLGLPNFDAAAAAARHFSS